MKRSVFYLLLASFAYLQALVFPIEKADALSLISQEMLDSEHEEIYVFRNKSNGVVPAIDIWGGISTDGVQTDPGSEEWVVKKVKGVLGAYTIKNRYYSQVDIYLHLINGQLSVGPADPLDVNSQWDVINLPDGVRIASIAVPGVYLHTTAKTSVPPGGGNRAKAGLRAMKARLGAGVLDIGSPETIWELLTPAQFTQGAGPDIGPLRGPGTAPTQPIDVYNTFFDKQVVLINQNSNQPLAVGTYGSLEMLGPTSRPDGQVFLSTLVEGTDAADPFFRFQPLGGPSDQYLHIENGALELSAAPGNWWSAMWGITLAPDNSLSIRSRWLPERQFRLTNEGQIVADDQQAGTPATKWIAMSAQDYQQSLQPTQQTATNRPSPRQTYPSTGNNSLPTQTQQQPSGTPATVELVIINNGFDNLSIAAIDDPQNPVPLAELALGEQYVQPAYPGNQLGFAAGGQWVGQPYVVTAAIGQTLGFDEAKTFVSFIDEETGSGSATAANAPTQQQQQPSGTPATVELVIINNGFDNLSIAAIDDPQNPVPLAELALGEQYVQPAYPGNQIGFAAGGQWVGQPYVVTGDAGQTLGFDESRSFVSFIDDETGAGGATAANEPTQQQQQPSGIPATVELVIINNGFDNLSIAAIDDPQNPVPLAELALGEQYVQPAYPGNQLGFAAGGQWVGQPYVVTADAGQTLGFDETRTFVSFIDEETGSGGTTAANAPTQPQQQPSGTPATVELVIINNGFDNLSIAAIDDPQNPVPLAELALGEQYVQPAYPGNQIGFAAGGQWVGQPYTVTANAGQTLGFDESQTFVSFIDDEATSGAIDQNVPAQQPGTGGASQTVNVTVINNGFDSLSIAAIDDPQNPLSLAELALSEQYVQPAYPGNQLGFASGGQWVGQPYTVTGDAGQTIGFNETQAFVAFIDDGETQPPANTDEPLTTLGVLINNDAYEVITIAAIDDPENPIPLADLPFGAHYSQEAYPGNILGFLIGDQWLEDSYEVSRENGQTVQFDDQGQMQTFLDDGNFLAQLQAREQQLAAPREPGPNDVQIEFLNTTSSTIWATLIPDDPNAEPATLFEIAPFESKQEYAPNGGTLGFYNVAAESYEGEFYTVNGTSQATVQIPWKDPSKRDLLLVNNAGYPLTILALAETENGDPEALVELQANSSQTISVKLGTKVQAYDFDNETFDGGEYQVNANATQNLAVPIRDPGSVEVLLQNPSGDDLGAQRTYSDPNRPADYLATVRAGKSARIYPKPGETISFSNFTTNEWSGGDYSVQQNAVQSISLPLKGGDADGDGFVSQSEIQTIASKIAQSIAAQQIELLNQPERCWRNSYGRGVGKIPNGCPSSHPSKETGLCYKTCPSGFTGFAATCVQDCPRGYTSDGLISCIKPAPYERSAFVWKLGDTLFSLDDARARCSRSSDGKKYGCVTANADTIVYSGCPRGMKTAPLITSLCTPICPSGMTDSGIGCFKNNRARGVGRIPNVCNASRKDGDGNPITDFDAGLCYKQCNSGYNGVGPVCWGQCPRGWVNCGAGCAKDTNACIAMISDQVSSPLMVAGNAALIALTAGAAAGGTAAVNAGKTAAKTAATTAAKLAARAAAKTAIRAKVRAALRIGMSQSAKAAGKAVAKDLAMDTAISAALVTTFTNVTDSIQREQIRASVRQQVIQELEKGISDEQIDAAIEIAMEGSDAEDGIAGNFPWESLDPTGVAEVVVAYNNPLCATIKTE